jgi:hypothetical protein
MHTVGPAMNMKVAVNGKERGGAGGNDVLQIES